MKAKWFWMPASVVALLAGMTPLYGQTPMGTAFTYQGQLKLTGEPLDDSADFEFRLFDAPSGGTELGMVPVSNVAVVDGLFTVVLDFGISPFTGDARWLEIDVRSPSGGGEFTTLSPRQELTPTAYALYAETAGTAPGGVTGTGTVDCIPKFTGSTAIGDSAIYEVSGHVGIGTTAPEYKLHVEGQTDARLYLRNTGQTWTGVLFDANHSLADRSIGVLRGLWAGERVADIVMNTGDNATERDGGRIRFLTKYSGQTIAQRMRIEPNGFVGVGSGVPADKLEVRGGTARVTSTMPTLRFNETDTTDSNWQIRANFGRLVFQTESDDFSNPVNRVAFLQDGKVGIGTNNPGTSLDVVGTARMDGFELPTGAADGFVLTSDASGTGTWQPAPGGLSGSGTAGAIAKFTDSDTIGDSVIAEADGKIGIGTGSPDTDLSVAGVVRGAYDATEGEYVEISHGGSNGYVNWRGDGRLDFRYTDDSDGVSTLMSIEQDGGVGIGTTSPAYELDVDGDIRATGTVYGGIPAGAVGRAELSTTFKAQFVSVDTAVANQYIWNPDWFNDWRPAIRTTGTPGRLHIYDPQGGVQCRVVIKQNGSVVYNGVTPYSYDAADNALIEIYVWPRNFTYKWFVHFTGAREAQEMDWIAGLVRAGTD